MLTELKAEKHHIVPVETLIKTVNYLRQKTLKCIEGLSDEKMMGTPNNLTNPFLWEIGHVAYFYDGFVLQQLDKKKHPFKPDLDELYNSFEVDHSDRWDLNLSSLKDTLTYFDNTTQKIFELLSNKNDAVSTYLTLLACYHETMHTEAFVFMRQTLGYSKPDIGAHNFNSLNQTIDKDFIQKDVFIKGGNYQLGAFKSDPFIFDNEKWAIEQVVEPFYISNSLVTVGEYLDFVNDGGYLKDEFWCYSGKMWKKKSNAQAPLYWIKKGATFQVREFDQIKDLNLNNAMNHVNWFEASAYTKWAGRRLPTELEWEACASSNFKERQITGTIKKRNPWGDQTNTGQHALMDLDYLGSCDVSCYNKGDNPLGIRQLTGNVWEWTSTPFYPFKGYEVDKPYKEYSAPWFGYRKVLKGGCYASSSLMVHNGYRNFYTPERNDVFAGIRTCKI